MPKKGTRKKRTYPSPFNPGGLVILVSSLVLGSLVLIGTLLLAEPVAAPNTRDDSLPSAETRAHSDPLALGVFLPDAAEDPSSIDRFADTTGKRPAIVMWFQGWENDGEFDEPRLDAVSRRGAMPMVTWEPWNHRQEVKQSKYALRKIASGKHDAYIRRWARDAAAWDKPLYLRFAHEMNGSWYPWGVQVNGNTRAQYVAAWRHVVRIFRQEGATKVRWVWSPSAEVLGNGVAFEEIYPGDDYVDWVALDGYNWGTTRSHSDWTSLAKLFGPSYDVLTAMTDKPIMIAEMASAEAGGDKAAWIRDGFLEGVPSRLPKVEAVVWFNSDKEADWRVDSSVRALEAYRDVATSPLYGGLP